MFGRQSDFFMLLTLIRQNAILPHPSRHPLLNYRDLRVVPDAAFGFSLLQNEAFNGR
jgi:hypothetical protein